MHVRHIHILVKGCRIKPTSICILKKHIVSNIIGIHISIYNTIQTDYNLLFIIKPRPIIEYVKYALATKQ